MEKPILTDAELEKTVVDAKIAVDNRYNTDAHSPETFAKPKNTDELVRVADMQNDLIDRGANSEYVLEGTDTMMAREIAKTVAPLEGTGEGGVTAESAEKRAISESATTNRINFLNQEAKKINQAKENAEKAAQERAKNPSESQFKQLKINVKAHPKSKFEKVIEHEEVYNCYFNVPPEKGKANDKIIEMLVSYFGVRKCDVKILAGKTSRDKIIEIIKEQRYNYVKRLSSYQLRAPGRNRLRKQNLAELSVNELTKYPTWN